METSAASSARRHFGVADQREVGRFSDLSLLDDFLWRHCFQIVLALMNWNNEPFNQMRGRGPGKEQNHNAFTIS